MAGKGGKCAVNDWAIVHYKEWLDHDDYDKLTVADSDKDQTTGGAPKVFRLGRFEVSKCWDIALQQM